jgi:tetratricopeptide (TPR) repeat protein
VKDFTKSVAAVEALGRDAPEYRRYADGTLAGLHLVTGQYAAARERFQQFVVRYPDSPYAWAAVLRIGQTFEAEGNSDQALAAYIQAGERYGSIPAAQVIAWALAGRIHDSRHRFAEALNAYRRAILAWDTGLGEQVHFGAPISWKVEGVPSTVRVSGELRKTAVAERLGGLIAALAHAGGEHLALGRLHLAARRYRHAAAAFQRFLDVHGSGPRRLEVTGLANHALLLAALDLAADYSPTFDESGALRELDALAKSDLDIYVLAARLAKAGIAWRRGLADEAEAAFGSALLEWQRHRAPRLRQRLSPLERDVMDIRTTFFTPLGSPIWGESARQWPTGMARLLVVNPEVQVSVPNTGPVEIEPLYNPPGPYSNVLFLSRDESAVLAQVIRALGRPDLLPPSTTPLPAIDPSRTILALFNRFFPAYETGHFGLSMYARPTLHRISFLDLERTKANIVVTRDGDGSETYRIEKNNGAWTIKQRLSITIQ